MVIKKKLDSMSLIIDRLSTIWKSDRSDKINPEFSQTVPV